MAASKQFEAAIILIGYHNNPIPKYLPSHHIKTNLSTLLLHLLIHKKMTSLN